MAENPPALPPPDPGTSARQDPLVGRRLGTYEILARVARGGMGVVYRARHVYIDKVVALKVLDPALSSRKELIARFRTEAQSLARVEHENVVKVNDIVEAEGLHFIVMDFVEGVNLRTLVKERGPLRPRELLSVARQTAGALLFAHRQGILHRDIKPENIIMSSRGLCKLTDFGLAGDLRLISEGREGALNFGTPAYAAPEILRRQTPDARSDVFSFGATMYHLATGETPFGPNNAQTIALKQRQGAELLEARRPDLPQSLCTLVQSCIAFNPAERPLDFEEILQRLPKRIIERSTPDTPTAPSGPLTTTESLPPSKSPRALLVVAALAVVAAFSVVGYVVVTRSASPLTANNAGDDAPVADGTSNNRPLANRPVGDGRPGDDSGKDGSSVLTPADEAFNNALFMANRALRAGDYAGAWAAWQDFIGRHSGDLAVQARIKAETVAHDFAEARRQAYAAAFDAADRALQAGDSGAALLAWDRLPGLLLKPLHDDDKSDFTQRVEGQRRRVLSHEADLLTSAFLAADRLRARNEFLAERETLEKLLEGRTEAGRERLNMRLAELKDALDAARRAAADALNHDRELVVGRRAELALWLKLGLDQLGLDVQHRRWGRARVGLSVLGKDLADAVLKRSLEAFAADLDLASRSDDAFYNALDRVRRRGAVTQIRFHTHMMADETRAPGTELVSGRIASLSPRDITLRTDNGDRSFSLALATAESVRTFLREGSIDDRLCLVAFMLAAGMVKEAQAEAGRLLGVSSLPNSVAARAELLRNCEVLGQPALRRLAFYAVRGGKLELSSFISLFGQEGADTRLLELQQAVFAGEAASAREYLALAANALETDLISPVVVARAVETLPAASRADIELWLKFEPRNPRAWLRLARRQQADNLPDYRRAALKALELDPGLEEAWVLVK